MTERPRIQVRSLYKIFGSSPESVLSYVRQGMGKDELLEKHGHVLGLRDINLDIQPRAIFVVMGLSGSGKSTLIRHFNRIIEPTAGRIEIGRRDILSFDAAELREFRRRGISMVFQRFALLPHRTVADNVVYGLSIQGVASNEGRARAKRWIERVGLSGYEDHYPAQLSGGMQQRVGLARALATDADILLMDEAFSALDPLIRSDMQDMLLELQRELGKTIIFITHDLEEALRLGDKIAIMRDGEIVQQGGPQDILLAPADSYVADFVKGINRGKAVEVRSIMEPLAGASPAVRLPGDTALEEALLTLTQENAKSACVVDETGDAVGHVDIKKLVTTLAVNGSAGTGRR